jgi:hypothetical protein
MVGCYSQTKKTIYCFPGQGADKRIFDSLNIDTSFELKVIEYGTPDKHMTLKSFAIELSKQIDTTKEFVLIGVSLGGMICSELSELLNPEKTIIISSAKNRNELPFRYRFQKTIPIYKLFPGCFLLAGAKLLQPIVEPDRKKNKATFKAMLAGKNGKYMKRTINLIIKWDRKNNSKKIYHIHGNKDHTLPLKKIQKPDYIIQNGSHMMTLTRAREISLFLNKILCE